MSTQVRRGGANKALLVCMVSIYYWYYIAEELTTRLGMEHVSSCVLK